MSANQRGPENEDCLFSIDPTAIKIGKEIGKGAFSVVYTGEYNKKHVAVKCQPKDEQGNIPTFVLKEVQILQRLRHINILEFIGAADSRRTRQILILSEHSNHGDLNQLLKSIRKGGVTHLGWAKMVQIALDIARGIAFMHSQQFIHRDIKSSNILLDDSFSAKLCDFGFATETSWWREPATTTARRKSYCGTDAFMAPEMFLDEDYNENVDVFSFGVVLMEILCCREANQDDFLMRLPQHKFQIQTEEFRSALPISCPAPLAQLAEKCVSFEPSERPTADEVVSTLEELLAQKTIMESGREPVVLRAYTPTPRMVMEEHEPQIEDDDDYGEEEEEEEEGQDEEETSSACGGDIEQATIALTPPVRTSGVMLKRNRRGNRGWSEKLFILENDQLHYTDLPTKQDKNNRRQSLSTPAPTISSLILKECRIWKTMEMPELSFNILDGNWKIKRELRALNHEDLEKWMRVINQAIDYANEEGQEQSSCEKIKEERQPEVTGEDDDELNQWLSTMGLQRYTPTFKAKGFSSLDFVRETGIETDDLNFLGIKDSAARKTLINAAKTLRGED